MLKWNLSFPDRWLLCCQDVYINARMFSFLSGCILPFRDVFIPIRMYSSLLGYFSVRIYYSLSGCILLPSDHAEWSDFLVLVQIYYILKSGIGSFIAHIIGLARHPVKGKSNRWECNQSALILAFNSVRWFPGPGGSCGDLAVPPPSTEGESPSHPFYSILF